MLQHDIEDPRLIIRHRAQNRTVVIEGYTEDDTESFV